jgi:hypothetical protein
MKNMQEEIVMKHAQWYCDTNGGENVCHKSIQQAKSVTPVNKMNGE